MFNEITVSDLGVKQYCKYCRKDTTHTRKNKYGWVDTSLDIITFGMYSLFGKKKKFDYVYCKSCGYTDELSFLSQFIRLNSIQDFIKLFVYIVVGMFVIRLFMMVVFLLQG